MKIIFGTTNERKVEDFKQIVKETGLDIEVLGMKDIGWNLGEIEENGTTIEENSLIKASAIHNFCLEHNITYPIITDDAGLFVEYLNGEPGIYTARYADDELALDNTLPKYQCVIKLLRNLNEIENRKATYRCAVTCMLNDGTYIQEIGESNGHIATSIIGELKKPYFYSVFILDGYEKAFSDMSKEELQGTYRHTAMTKILHSKQIKTK